MRITWQSEISSLTFQLSLVFAQVSELVFILSEYVTLFIGCSAQEVWSLGVSQQPVCQRSLRETHPHVPEITQVWGTQGERKAAAQCWGTERSLPGHQHPWIRRWCCADRLRGLLAPPQVPVCLSLLHGVTHGISPPNTFERADMLTWHSTA